MDVRLSEAPAAAPANCRIPTRVRSGSAHRPPARQMRLRRHPVRRRDHGGACVQSLISHSGMIDSVSRSQVPPVLVTGVTGRVGRAVIDQLVDAGVPVRAGRARSWTCCSPLGTQRSEGRHSSPPRCPASSERRRDPSASGPPITPPRSRKARRAVKPDGAANGSARKEFIVMDASVFKFGRVVFEGCGVLRGLLPAVPCW